MGTIEMVDLNEHKSCLNLPGAWLNSKSSTLVRLDRDGRPDGELRHFAANVWIYRDGRGELQVVTDAQVRRWRLRPE